MALSIIPLQANLSALTDFARVAGNRKQWRRQAGVPKTTLSLADSDGCFGMDRTRVSLSSLKNSVWRDFRP